MDLDARTASILSLLERVPRIHLVVLDALLSHLNSLISGTKSQEPDADFITKLVEQQKALEKQIEAIKKFF